MNIVAKLNRNLHPKDCDNMSLVDAHNMKLSNDGSCLVTEESIKKNDIIENYLNSYYKDKGGFDIVGVIPCNKELVLIVVGKNNTTKARIFRYTEETNSTDNDIHLAYGNDDNIYFEYHGGEINGTFTYNVEGSLIVAIAEYKDDNSKIPLRTINLGNITNNEIKNDSSLNDDHISIVPKAIIPFISDVKYLKGTAYKGWYHLFIRYKINNNDYTQWYNFGRPVYNDTLNKTNIIKYVYATAAKSETDLSDAEKIYYGNDDNLITGDIIKTKCLSAREGFGVGCTDYISDTKDLCNETFNINISNIDTYYDEYQLGIVCLSKTYSKCFRTNDININNTNFTFKSDNVSEYSITDLINTYYNYYNVKNICNYNNRLYIANYNEGINKNNIIVNAVNQINVNLVKINIPIPKVSQSITFINESDDNVGMTYNQYENALDANSNTFKIPLYKYLGTNNFQYITISGKCRRYNSDLTEYIDTENITITDTIDKFSIRKAMQQVAGIYINGQDVKTIIINYTGDQLKEEYSLITFIDSVEVTLNDKTNTINCNKIATGNGVIFNDISESFNDRKSAGTFIPGEVYNFYIHFVDKYGAATNGYKLTNKVKYTNGGTEELCPIPFEYYGTTYYAAAPDVNILDEHLRINSQYITIYETLNDTTLLNPVDDANIKNSFINIYNNFIGNATYKDITWFQLSNGCGINNFLPYYNINDEKLFRFPIPKSRYTNDETIGWNIELTNVVVPKGYIGYYMSYEKYEPIKQITGVLTKSDGNINDYYSQGRAIINNSNNDKSKFMYFYSDELNTKESIKLNYNAIRIDSAKPWIENENYWRFQRLKGFEYCYNYNTPQAKVDFTNNPTIYPMPEYKLLVANDISNNRQGKSTTLKINNDYGLFNFCDNDKSTGNNVDIYKVTLLNLTKNLYTNSNKELIRCSNIIYNNSYCSSDNIYPNGKITYDGVIIYNNIGLNFDTADNVAYKLNSKNRFYPTETNDSTSNKYNLYTPICRYIQYYTIDTYFHESKCFKNAPTKYSTVMFEKGNNAIYGQGTIIEPKNTIDLFENKQLEIDSNVPKTYTNYRSSDINIDKYTKVIRRSNIISNESKINAWRQFPLEGYKIINENKGDITNIIGVGTIFLVHTEHSMFMFNIDDTLKTDDKNIQLASQDVFDVNYKEVFTSKNGYAGLQDTKAAIFDSFGYIFYCNADNRFYRFDGGKLSNIDNDIVQWLNMYKPNNIRFANDKFNNRVLIKFDYDIWNETKEDVIKKYNVISYNYNTNTFISLHDYYFDEAFNTEFELYMKCNNETHSKCSLHQFVSDKNNCCNFDNIKNNIGVSTKVNADISVIFNANYNIIKFVDFITYKLSKLKDYIVKDNISLPVEEIVNPYAGDKLIVFNDKVTTDLMNIAVDSESDKNIFGAYKKPYWYLGNWNFSYLRNNIAAYNQYGDGFGMTRLFGNFFVFKFIFGDNTDSKRIEFESLDVKVTTI